MKKRFCILEHKGQDYIFDIDNAPDFHNPDTDFIELLGSSLGADEIVDLLNDFDQSLQQERKRNNKLQSKYDKSKTDELKILVETDNTVLLDKEEFHQYVRRHNELKRRNKRRKEKNRKYRNELKKRLKEISGLKEFIQEDLCSEDKVLKGFIEEYL